MSALQCPTPTHIASVTTYGCFKTQVPMISDVSVETFFYFTKVHKHNISTPMIHPFFDE